MTKEEFEKLKQTIAYFGHWYDVIGEERVSILEKSIKYIEELEKENIVLKKALNLYVDWADECGIAWDNFPDMAEKWYKIVEEKGLGWIDGLIFMVMQEAKEQLTKESEIEND